MHLPPHLLHLGTLGRTEDVHLLDETTCGSRSHTWSCQGPRRAKRGGVGKGGGAVEWAAPACHQDMAGSSQPAMAMEAAGCVCYASDPRIPAWGQQNQDGGEPGVRGASGRKAPRALAAL